MPTSRGQQTRDQILDVAAVHLRQHGFAATRVEKVASEAYVSVGTVYLHFESKDGLYAAVLERAEQVLFGEYLLPAYDSEGEPWQVVRQWAHSYARFTIEHPESARLLVAVQWFEVERPPHINEAVQRLIATSNARGLELLEHAAKLDQLQGVSPADALLCVWGQVHGLCATVLRHPDLLSDDPGRLIHLVDQALALLSGGRVGSPQPSS